MSEEAVVAAPEAPVADVVVPDASATAAPVDSPVVGEEAKPEAKPEAAKDEKSAKTFTQDDLDRVAAKANAVGERRAARKLQREVDQRVQEALARQKPADEPTQEAAQRPRRDQFQDDDTYVEALADFKAKEVLRVHNETSEKQRREEQQRQWKQAVEQTFAEREDSAREKYDDYDDVVGSEYVPITQPMADAIKLMDKGPDVAYYLGTNIEEAKRIAKLHPLKQAQELGRIEDKLASAPPPAKPSSAPEPIAPVGRPSASPGYVDTLDPRSLAKLGTTGWIEAERKRQIAKQKAAQG